MRKGQLAHKSALHKSGPLSVSMPVACCLALFECGTIAWLPQNLVPDSLGRPQRTINHVHAHTSLLQTQNHRHTYPSIKHGPLTELCQQHPAVHTMPRATPVTRTLLSHRTTLSAPAPPVFVPLDPTSNSTHDPNHARGCIHAHASRQYPACQAGITLHPSHALPLALTQCPRYPRAPTLPKPAKMPPGSRPAPRPAVQTALSRVAKRRPFAPAPLSPTPRTPRPLGMFTRRGAVITAILPHPQSLSGCSRLL